MSDLDIQNRVVVNIYGQEYAVAGHSDPSSISRVADYVDLRMKEISAGSRVQSIERLAILTAMSLASELQEKSDQLDQLRRAVEHHADATLARLDRALSR